LIHLQGELLSLSPDFLLMLHPWDHRPIPRAPKCTISEFIPGLYTPEWPKISTLQRV